MKQNFQTRINPNGYYITIRGIPRDKLLDTYFELYKRFNVVQSRIYHNGGGAVDLKHKPLTFFSSGLTTRDKQLLIEKIEYELLFSDSVVLTVTKKKRGGSGC